MDKITYNNIEDSVDIIANIESNNPDNKWMNYTYDTYKGNNLIFHKDKTWQNCWLKYSLISSKPYSDSYVLESNYYNNIKFPLITNLKDYIENGGNINNIIKHSENSDKILDDLYKIHSEIDWSKNPVYVGYFRNTNFIGSSWYTNGWDARGVNLGKYWNQKWTFNFKSKSVEIPYMFAGSNMSIISLRFKPNSSFRNAQGLFKGYRANINVSIEDENGDTLISDENRGFSPTVMIEMFKQLGGYTIKDNGSWINWSNCHSASGFLFDAFSQSVIASFNNEPIGNPSLENTFYPNKTNEKGTYPNYNRVYGGFLKNAHALISFGPLIDMKYAMPQNTKEFFGPKIQDIRIRNLNGGNWDFSNSTMNRESAIYLLYNVYDRVSKYQPYSHLDAEAKRVLLDETLVLEDPSQIKYKIIIPESWKEYLTEDMKRIIRERGWELYSNNLKIE